MKPRKTQHLKGLEEGRTQTLRILAASIDCFPDHISEVTASLLGGDDAFVYCELERFTERLKRVERRGRKPRLKKETVIYDSANAI